MFQIKNGRITLNKSKSLTAKQVATLGRMHNEAERNRYLMSLMGLVKGRHFVPRIKRTGHDILLSKSKGSILKQMQRLQNLERDHKPNDNGLGQWVGVEIECIIPHQSSGERDRECECVYDDDGDEVIEECGYCRNDQESYWSETDAHEWLKSKLADAGVTRCCVKDDGSLNDDDGHGVEVTILFNTKYGYEPLAKLCRALTKAGCYVNKSCGLHVHLDARHLTVKQTERIGASLGHSLPVLKYLVAKSRHANDYCELRVSKLIKISHDDDTWDERYCAINLTSYPRYKTIEVRLHGGSINASKIEAWVTLLKLIGASKLKSDITTFQELIDLGLSEPMVEYAEQRIAELNPEAWPLLSKPETTIETVANVAQGVA